MKAKDYFAKYGPSIWSEKVLASGLCSADEMFKEMTAEISTLAEKRHAKEPASINKIVLEINDKWNAVCRLYEKKYGELPESLSVDRVKTEFRAHEDAVVFDIRKYFSY